MSSMRGAATYISPYVAGVGIGLTLLAAFALAGRGLGATGAYSTIVATSAAAIAPQHTAASQAYSAYIPEAPDTLLDDWLLVEVLGVLVGALLSATLSRRFRIRLERGMNTGTGSRVVYAIIGGLLMGFGAKLARGCTSGQGLTGGAMFSVGSWLFIVSAFACAYLVAPWIRRQWQ